MFSQRRSNRKLPVELYAQFRQSHGKDVASGTSPAIHLSPAESMFLERSNRLESAGTERFERLPTTTPGLGSLSSVSVGSLDDAASATPKGYMMDVFALDGATFEQCTAEDSYQSGHAPLDRSLSISDPQKTWLDFFGPKKNVPGEERADSFSYPASFITPALLSSNNTDDMDITGKDEDDADCKNTSMCLLDDESNGNKDNSQIGQSTKTRFCHILNAPPALRKEPGGDLVTYLNKGSQYSLLVKDAAASSADSASNRLYCTSVQVAFDTEAQRERPLASWQLWNQTRGADEVHLIHGRFLAIELINSAPSDKSDQIIPEAQVIHSDGFSVVWGADRGSPRECSIKFQLNFLSTDFSHVKGIHGASMQLCCKTEELTTDSFQYPTRDTSVNYCRIQVFRSHGAERKMSNDLATARKRITRLEQQLSQYKTLSKDTKIWRQKRKSTSSADPRRGRGLGSIPEDVLRSRIENLERNCISTTAHSLLDLQGEEQQHCDWYPSKRDRAHQGLTPGMGKAGGSFSTSDDNRITSIPLRGMRIEDALASSSLSSPPRIDEAWHTALPTVNPTPRPGSTKAANFYVRPIDNDTYAPIYLVSRTASELTGRVAVAVGVDPGRVFRSIWLCDRGFRIIVDDDVVLNMKEGQGMRVAVNNIGTKTVSENPRDQVGFRNRMEELCELVLEF